MVYALDKRICHIYYVTSATIILSHFNERTARFIEQMSHKARVRATKFIDVLIIIAHGNHSHVLICCHESMHQLVFFLAHILCFVNDEDCLADAVRLHFSVIDHLSRTSHDVFRFIQITNLAEQVEGIGVESLYLHEVCGIADKLH